MFVGSSIYACSHSEEHLSAVSWARNTSAGRRAGAPRRSTRQPLSGGRPGRGRIDAIERLKQGGGTL
eukprot:scaffold50363_cov59-Phaeocystis_antarctica.AAC.2